MQKRDESDFKSASKLMFTATSGNKTKTGTSHHGVSSSVIMVVYSKGGKGNGGEGEREGGSGRYVAK